MKIFLAFIIPCVLSVVTIVNNKTNFNAQQNYPMLLFFVHSQCTHCDNLEPQIAELDKYLAVDTPSVKVSTLDCGAEQKMCKARLVYDYPYIRLYYSNENYSDYDDVRNAQKLTAWVKRKIDGPVFKIDSHKRLERYLNDHSVVILYFGADEQERSILTSVAKNYQNIVFISSEDKSLQNTYGSGSKISMVAHHLQKPLAHQGIITQQALVNFIESNRFNKVMDFTIETADFIFGNSKTALFLFYSKDSEDAKNELLLAALRTESNLPLVAADYSLEATQRFVNLIGLSEEDIPTIRIISPTGSKPQDLKKYVYDEKVITAPKIIQFIGRYHNKKVHQNFKSNLTHPEVENNIRVLNGNSYQQVVNDVTRDVVVFVYKLQCIHCKTLLPVLEQIANQRTKLGLNNVIIAKIDASANDLPVKVERYPTLLLYTSVNKEPIFYEGDRTYSGLVKWFQEHRGQSRVEL